MAMAKLFIVVLKASGRRGRTYDNPKTNQRKKIFIVTGSRRVGDDGRHDDDVKGHHVEVGVGVLPNERVEDVILDCDLDIVINNDGDVDGVMLFTVKVQQMELIMKAVVTG